jgi:hypothetical protein
MRSDTFRSFRGGDNLFFQLRVGWLRQSVFGRLAGYGDVNDAERLRHDPAMRWIVGGKAAQGRADYGKSATPTENQLSVPRFTLCPHCQCRRGKAP